MFSVCHALQPARLCALGRTLSLVPMYTGNVGGGGICHIQ